jgi:hypothetical protein
VGKNEENLKLEKKLKKKSFRKKNFGSNNEIGPWFWLPIPKPGFGRTLVSSVACFAEWV